MIRFHVQETTEDTFAIDSQGPLQAAHAVLVSSSPRLVESTMASW